MDLYKDEYKEFHEHLEAQRAETIQRLEKIYVVDSKGVCREESQVLRRQSNA